MKIGVIGAMEPEVVHLIEALENKKTQHIAGIEFISGNYANHDLIITRSGIGKVAASMAATLLIQTFSPEKIINTGSAGGFADDLEIGDIVISTEVRHHDADLTAFGYEIGQLPQNPAAFIADEQLLHLSQGAIEKVGQVKSKLGLICSGDTFVCDPERTKVMLKNFPTMAACEMEGAAIAQVCYKFKIPFVVIRSLSDNANNDSAVDFDSYIVKAGHHSALVVLALVELI